MYLKKVTLNDVRMFSHQEVAFTEGVNAISAPNRWGKTTVADAVSFLLTGKLYSGSADIASLKPIDDTSKAVSVEAIFVLSDGSELILRKEYQENWVTTRGTTDTYLSGHNTTSWINGVKKLQKEFDREVCEFFKVPDQLESVSGMEMIQGLTNAYYFSEVLPWNKLLVIINRVIGKVNASDVYGREPKTKRLDMDLAKVAYKIPELRKKYQERLKDRTDAQSDLKAQINGDSLEKPLGEEEFTKAATQVSSLERQILDLRVKKQGIKNPVIENLIKELATAETNLVNSQRADNTELSKKNALVVEKVAELNKKLSGIETRRAEVSLAKNKIQMTIDDLERKTREEEALILRKEAEKNALYQKYDEVDGSTYTPVESHLCPNCQFDLSAEENERREKEFVLEKEDKLSKIVSQGKQLAAEIEQAKKSVADNKNILETIRTVDIPELNAKEADFMPQLDKIHEEIQETEAGKRYYFESEATVEIKKRIENIQAAIMEEENKSLDTAAIDEEILQLVTSKAEAQAVVDEYNAQKRILARKIEREKNLEAVKEEIADAQTDLDDLKLYTETLLKLISERIQEKFGDIKVRLIKENIKAGSWDEVCDIMIETDKGEVPYATANTEAKIRTGVKLADRIAEHLGIERLPMWIDDCEHITESNRVFDSKSQIVMLIASEEVTGQA